MVKKNKSLTEANAYKARSEGTAAIIKALMPLILLVAGSGIYLLYLRLGVDFTHLKQLSSLLTATR